MTQVTSENKVILIKNKVCSSSYSQEEHLITMMGLKKESLHMHVHSVTMLPTCIVRIYAPKIR